MVFLIIGLAIGFIAGIGINMQHPHAGPYVILLFVALLMCLVAGWLSAQPEDKK